MQTNQSKGYAVNIEPYVFAEAERVRYGRFPMLDTVLYRWARRIEETLFEYFHTELYAGSSIVEEMKFSAFYGSLKSPRPIYLFELEPFPGTGLFVLDNRFAQLCLDGDALGPKNQERVQRVVQQMMADLDASWASIWEVKSRLKRITTYLFRARILNPYEPCLVAQIHLSGARASSRLTWCFPRIMLDSMLRDLRTPQVIPSLYPQRSRERDSDSTSLLEQMPYDLRVSLGEVDFHRVTTDLHVGSVLPLANTVGGDAVLEINGAPLLVGSVGEVRGCYAVKITGTYEERAEPSRLSSAPFRAIEWPGAN